VILLLCVGCYRVPDRIDPRVSYDVQVQRFQMLESAFAPLTPEEQATDWGKEVRLAEAFAQELDLYRAVSTFKRASYLLPKEEALRRLEIDYAILLCYFLGKKYDDAVSEFERTGLASADKSFPAYHDLLLVLYECYQEMQEPVKQAHILETLERSFPDTAEKVKISSALRMGALGDLEGYASSFTERPSYLDGLLENYEAEKKSVGKAQLLNALIPGAGYLYIGQAKSAVTAFLLNGLFLGAAYQFFHRGHLAAGIITIGFEAGWYFGGIYGAGQEAKYYNERLYEKSAVTVLNDHELFPVLMLDHAF
jgi:tetratricopeptide (TPR) repeat protein